MDFSMILAIFLGLWVLRLLRVNDRLRRTDPFDRAWQQFERRQQRRHA